MGIMHGDNSGMFAACKQLSKMFASAGNVTKSKVWETQAELFRMRTNALCWNGKYYAHFIVDDPLPEYLKIDQQNTLSLSNPYDVNRGLATEEMAMSIINTYRKLKDHNKMNAFAEWFGIYPAVEPHFADFEPGTYMNGGINTIVGGELAKAALQHGAEGYGVDILNRILALMTKHQGNLPVGYTSDGVVDEGIPDNWGQAAVFSAIVEGLVGVVDKSKLFEDVEISPRWIAANKKDVETTISYGPSLKSVSYHFKHDNQSKQISLELSGDAKTYQVRLLLPEGKIATAAKVDNATVGIRCDIVGNSKYVCLPQIHSGSHIIIIKYK